MLDAASLERAIGHNEAVACALGAPAARAGAVGSQGTRNILGAMERTGVRRLVCLTSLGYGDSRPTLDRTPLYFKHLIVPFLLRKTFIEHALQEQLIKQSPLDWVVVRAGALSDGPRTGVYRHGFSCDDETISVSVSRADVADFMLDQLSSDAYLHRTPGVSY